MSASLPIHPDGGSHPLPAARRSTQESERALRYYIETWGCQMNVHDSEKLSGTLDALGYVAALSTETADLVLLNTCAVREKAAEKIFTELGWMRLLKTRNPEMIIGVTGCVASMEGERIFRRAPHVDFVMGPRGILNLPALLVAARARRRAIDVVHHQESVLYPWERIRRRNGHRAYVTIMEGCNKSCTYCIVPATRGPETSRSVDELLREVRSLVESGFKEIEFLGQTVNAFRDLSGRRLSHLLREADRIDGVRRLRFTTSHPLHMTDDLMRAMAEAPRVVRYLHLPVQSGSDDVLRRMKRGYTRNGYLGRIRKLRSLVPDLSLSTDVIVGFPGETEKDFTCTMELLEEIGYDNVYSFLYSPRPGTEAEQWQDGIPFEEKPERLARLQGRQEEIQADRYACWIGRTVEVLIEGPAKIGEGWFTGRTFHGHIVNFPSAGHQVGELVRIRIERAGKHSLKGRAVGEFS